MPGKSSTAPVTARPAATVILLRDSVDGPEVLLMERHKSMDFGAGAMVFPGGKIEDSDRDPALIALCPGGESESDPLLSFRIGGIRELFEEAGILLACHATGIPVSDAERRQWVGAPLGDLAGRESLIFDPSALIHFAHWVTPEPVAIRFDTHFFAARVPPEQEQYIEGDESVRMGWYAAKDVLTGEQEGELGLMFPTRLNLQMLAGFACVADILTSRAGQSIVTVMPEIIVEDGQVYVEIPPEAGYGVTRVRREEVMEARPPKRP